MQSANAFASPRMQWAAHRECVFPRLRPRKDIGWACSSRARMTSSASVEYDERDVARPEIDEIQRETSKPHSFETVMRQTPNLPMPNPTLQIADGDHTRGPMDAPTTVLVYGDYECPHTRAL